jgi:hypothetical protein
MMKKLLIVIMASVGLLLMPVSCASTQAPLPQKNGGGGEASWAFGFDNLTDLSVYSDVIIIGVVDRVVEIKPATQGRHTDYMTRWALRVEKVMKGKETKELVINQSGSPDLPGSDISDDPLFLPGERYLLFLRETTDGTYFKFGPWGRYLIWDNKVYSMNHILRGGYQAPWELNFYGMELGDMTGRITGIVDSVQLAFTQGAPRLLADVLRYSAGITLDIDVTLSAGKYGPGKVTLKINKTAFPEGLDASISPAEFAASPRSEYKSTLIITTSPELSPGSYRIPVEYDFSGFGQGSRTITLNINPAEIP